MSYLWPAGVGALLAAAAARLAGRPAQIVPWAVLGGLLPGAVRTFQPTLFRAENGFGGALLAFALPATLVGLVVGVIVRAAAPHRK